MMTEERLQELEREADGWAAEAASLESWGQRADAERGRERNLRELVAEVRRLREGIHALTTGSESGDDVRDALRALLEGGEPFVCPVHGPRCAGCDGCRPWHQL